MLKNNRKQKLIIISSTLLLAACSSTPTKQISQFGTAVDQLTTEIDNAITETNKKHIDYQLTKIANSSQLNSKDAKYNCPILLSKHGENVDPNGNKCNSIADVTFADITPIYAENEIKTLFLTRANKSLKGYAQSLQKLNDAATVEQVNASVVKLNNSMVGIYDQYEALSGDTSNKEAFNDSLSIVAAAVNAIGTSIIEDKRRKALKTTIIQANRWITSLTKEMEDQLAVGGFDLLIDAYDKKALDLKLFSYNHEMKNGQLTEAQSRAKVEALYTEWQIYSARKLKKKALIKSVQAIAKGHNTLKEQVEKDLFTSSEISNTISDLSEYYKQLTSFHELLASCEGTLDLIDDEYQCKAE